MNFPEDILYTSDHEWIRIEGDTALIGVTAFAQSELGDIVFVEVDTVGDVVEAGKVFGSVEAVKTVSDLYMPLTAEVLEVNPGIESSPETINSDPYGEGWIIRVKLQDPANRGDLLSAGAYRELVGH